MGGFGKTDNEQEKVLSVPTVQIKGRIEASKRIESEVAQNGYFYQTLVTVPAKDEYSHPQTYPIKADSPLGAKGSDITVTCVLRPSVRTSKEGKFYNLSLWQEA